MKKLTILLAACLVAFLVMSSCASQKKCPAYSQIKSEKVNTNS